MAKSGTRVLLGSRCVACEPRTISSADVSAVRARDVTLEFNETRRGEDIDYDGSYSAECVEKVHCFI